eukprot:216662_1
MVLQQHRVIDFTFCIATCLLLLFVYLPLTSYHAIKYFQNRHHIVFKKRYCWITIYESIFSFTHIITGVIWYISWLLYNTNRYGIHIYNIMVSLNECLAFIIFYLYVTRFWLFLFDIRLMITSIDNEWKYLINPKLDTVANFYTKNKGKYGKLSYVLCHFTIPITILSITFSLLAQTIPYFITQLQFGSKIYWFLQTLNQINLIIPLIALITIYAKMPFFADNFFIVQELKYLFIVILVAQLGAIGCNVYRLIYPMEISSIKNGMVMGILINIIWASQFACILITTYLVNKKVTPIIQEHRYTVKNLVLSKDSSYVPMPIQNDNSNINVTENYPLMKIKAEHSFSMVSGSIRSIRSRKNISLVQIFSNYKSLSIFIEHLSAELSIEYILSMIEFTQFELYILKYMKSIYGLKSNQDAESLLSQSVDDDKSSMVFGLQITDLWCSKVVWPNEVPQSFIVYGDNMIRNDNEQKEDNVNIKVDIELKAFKLYQKYIYSGGEFQLNNVSVFLKLKFNELIDDKTNEFSFNDSMTLSG